MDERVKTVLLGHHSVTEATFKCLIRHNECPMRSGVNFKTFGSCLCLWQTSCYDNVLLRCMFRDARVALLVYDQRDRRTHTELLSMWTPLLLKAKCRAHVFIVCNMVSSEQRWFEAARNDSETAQMAHRVGAVAHLCMTNFNLRRWLTLIERFISLA